MRRRAPGRRPLRSGWRYRANVASRSIAAVAGGYALASIAAFAAARAWPADRLQASVAGTMIAFLVAPAVAVWAFLAPSPRRAWGVLLALAGLLAAMAAALGPKA